MSKELERLDKYELLERLGRGGMGEVWKARDTQLRRNVAIKFLHADLQSDPDFVTHFMREAQFVASLHHPNIVQIHDFQLTDERGSGIGAYMVMDYVEGGTLAGFISDTSRKARFPGATDVVYLFTAVSLALDYAHRQGMIHRDIKPANILLDKRIATARPMGEPILTDFGIAKLQGASSSTVTRSGVGTPLYISPEQAQDHVVDERSDLYSLGIILYEVMTGITPFRGENPLAIMMQHVHETPPPPALINPNISSELSSVILQSIAKDPNMRFPTASALTTALAQALKVPVPASLGKPKIIHEQTEYNPLQPTKPVPSLTPYPPAQVAPTILPSTPASAGYPYSGAPSNSPAPLAEKDRGLQPQLVSPLPAKQPRRSRRGLYFTLIACVLLLLVAVSAFFVYPQLFANKTSTTPTPTTGSVGHITLMHGPNAPNNIYNQLQIQLSNLPAPPAGKSYYAWLVSPNNESIFPVKWELQLSNGAVNYLTPVDSNHPDLYPRYTQFLVSLEDTGAPNAIPDPASRLYYANLSPTTTSSPTFEVKPCPTSGTNACA
ncbi:MAG TPA: protein kinase [Ktedonobacteraceae bacterium]|nr:protein kinase [Ktedonobacteraceae bacterium]